MLGTSLDHPRMILDGFGEHHFSTKISSKIDPFMLMKGQALQYQESIVLSKPSVIPNQNNSFEPEKNVSAQTNVAISRFSHFRGVI